MDSSKIAIIIPAFNEQSSIDAVVRACSIFGSPIVVDDGSTDETSSVAFRSGALVVSHSCNLGYDAALNTGFLKAAEMGLDVVVTVDADGQHNAQSIAKCIAVLAEGADVAVGIRNRQVRISEFVFAFFTRILYKIEDPLCGLKGYRLQVYYSLGEFDNYKSIGTQLMLQAARNNLSIGQFSVEVQNRMKGTPSRFGSAFTANWKISRSMLICIWDHFLKKIKQN